MVNRLRITECIRIFKAVNPSVKMNNDRLAELALAEMPRASATLRQHISRWNRGTSFACLEPRYIQRIKEVLGVTYEQLIEEK